MRKPRSPPHPDFGKALPTAEISSTTQSRDRTVRGARGRRHRARERRQQGHVVRRMFADVDAIYVLVDGDATGAPSAPRMIDALVTIISIWWWGFRVDQSVAAYRPPPHRQLDADELPFRGVRTGVQGYPSGYRVLAAFRHPSCFRRL
jgi:hypothetical protein